MRATSLLRFARTKIGFPNVSATALSNVQSQIKGLKPRVPEVAFEACTSPLRAKVSNANGQQVPVAAVVEHLHRVLAEQRAKHNSDRGVISAPMLGYNARIIVVHSGLDRHAMINPQVTLTSAQKIHAWDPVGNDMVRVARHRSIAVKYQTTAGDDETWYALPLEESEVLQRHLDAFDGFSVADRVAPIKPENASPSVAASEDADGSLSIVPRTLFEQHQQEFMRFVEPVPRSKVVGCA